MMNHELRKYWKPLDYLDCNTCNCLSTSLHALRTKRAPWNATVKAFPSVGKLSMSSRAFRRMAQGDAGEEGMLVWSFLGSKRRGIKKDKEAF